MTDHLLEADHYLARLQQSGTPSTEHVKNLAELHLAMAAHETQQRIADALETLAAWVTAQYRIGANDEDRPSPFTRPAGLAADAPGWIVTGKAVVGLSHSVYVVKGQTYLCPCGITEVAPDDQDLRHVLHRANARGQWLCDNCGEAQSIGDTARRPTPDSPPVCVGCFDQMRGLPR